MDAKRIVVLEGDETGQELLEQALRVLEPWIGTSRSRLPHSPIVRERGLFAGALSIVYAMKKSRASVSPDAAFLIGMNPVVVV